MKNHIASLLLLFMVSFATSCEEESPQEPKPEEDIIEIPDEHFKHALVSTNSIDTNGDKIGDSDIDLNNDGEIQRREAELIEGLIMDFDYREIGRIVDFKGIGNFTNLQYLKITGLGDSVGGEIAVSELVTHDFTGLEKLVYLEFNNVATNASKVIDLSGLSNLTELKLLNNRPDYNVPEEDWENPVNFVVVNLQGTDNLISLNTTNSFLIIDFCQVPSLKKLSMFYLEGGEPEVFDFHCLTELEWLDISENYINSLILKNSSVLETLLAENIGSSGEYWNYPFVEYICLDDIPEEFEQIAPLRDENTVVVTDCTF